MSDFSSSLPVRTETNGDVAAKIVDGTITSQALTVDSSGRIIVKLDDGAGNAITSQVNGAQRALDVGIDVGGVQIDPRSIRALTSADTVNVNNLPATVDTNYGTVGASTLRSAAQIGNATGAADFNYGTVGAQTLRSAAQIGNATGAADFNAGATGAQTLRVTANQGTPGTAATGWFVKVTDGTNTQSVTAGGAAHITADNFPTTVDTNFGTVGANTLRTAAEVGNATGAADFNNGATGAQTLRVAANLAIGGANVTNLNPVPVTIEATPGTHVNDYKDASSIAAGASDNHDYTVTAGKTLHLNQVESSASGKAKMQVQVETGVATNSFTTYFVQFNSTAETNMSIRLMDDISVAAGVRVRVIMTNRDNQAQDLYSTISGFEI